MKIIMDMSLDEYITSFKAERKDVFNFAKNKEIKFKAERRSSAEEDEQLNDGDVEIAEIWKGPDASINYIDIDKDEIDEMVTEERTVFGKNSAQNQLENVKVQRFQPPFDLRDKISGSNGIKPNSNPDFNSQQWRLMQPNVVSQRPAGIPPLVPQEVFDELRTRQKRSGKNRYRNRNGFFNKSAGLSNGNGSGNNNINGNGNGYRINNGNANHNGYGYSNHNGYGNGYSNNKGFNNKYNSVRSQRFNQRPSNPHISNKNINDVSFNGSNDHLLPKGAQDLTIECTADSIELSSKPFRRPMMHSPAAAATPQVSMNSSYKIPVEAPVQTIGTNNIVNKPNDSLRTLLGISDNSPIKMEMLPMLASKVLDFFHNYTQQTTHKPIYDIKIQKQIHEIQKKPLLYKCPGGEVVSSDGRGINCHITPRTSGVSLNHRFA